MTVLRPLFLPSVSTERIERYPLFFPGVPPDATDILTFYVGAPTLSTATVTGAHVQCQQPPGATATFQIRTATGGGGSGFNVTVASGAVEGVATGQSLVLGEFAYIHALTPAGCGNLVVTLTVSLVTNVGTIAWSVPLFFAGVPAAGMDILTVPIGSLTQATVTGAHIQAQQPPTTGDLTVSIRTAKAGGGSGFTLTLPEGDVEAELKEQTLTLANADYLYARMLAANGAGDLTITLYLNQSGTKQHIPLFFAGVPPDTTDILTYHIGTVTGMQLTGAHVQLRQAPTATSTFQVRTALAGGGSAVAVTVAAGALEGLTTGATITPASVYLYGRCVTAAGAGSPQITMLMN